MSEQPTPDPAIDAEPVATGDRRDEVAYAPDPDQLVKAVHLRRPEGPLAPQMQVPEAVDPPVDNGVTDVREAPPSPSVWDARPPAEEP